MKGSINSGAVKDASESPLRALSAAPKCPLTGEQFIDYTLDIIYDGTTLPATQFSIGPAAGNGPVEMPLTYPHGQWVLDITVTIQNPIPASVKFSMAEGGPLEAVLGLLVRISRFLVGSLGGWQGVKLANKNFNQGKATTLDSWRLVDDGSFPPPKIGPDLFSIMDADFSSAGTQHVQVILPEQKEFCSFLFFPYMFTSLSVLGAGTSAWVTGGDGFQFVVGWTVFGIPGGLYPAHTKVGTVKFQFRRVSNVPLFSYTINPPNVFHFTNRSTAANPSLVPTWDWNFGDGSAHVVTPDTRDVFHIFPSTGTYDVILSSTDPTGTKTFDQLVVLPLKADFTFKRGFRPSQIAFTNQSLGATTYDWDFGDGSAHGTTANPTHDYVVLGQTFNATLTITDGIKTASITKTVNT